MYIVYLPMNQAYVLMLGESMIDVQGQMFWSSRKELLHELGFKSMEEFNAKNAERLPDK